MTSTTSHSFIDPKARAVRSSTYFWAVTATRQSLALYLRWEYGQRRAVELLRTAPQAFGAVAFFRTRREANDAANRIKIVVNHALGRLGRPANDGGLFVIRR